MGELNRQCFLPTFLGGLELIYGSWSYDNPKYGWTIEGDHYVVKVMADEPKDLEAKLKEIGRIKQAP
ncbi:hypothetical protein FLAG1_06710 [Fusarium langsethiae]|uniref:Uncharacterized protein n=1 Tax=Fusarium langsethiae TaxID=179993 RepID=A0A0N1J2L9_FUSLA|nr:hypothetical protein FLAG1_06710 [Fusarium langsethiae]GKU05775.1 unnamed protein product [Fusarium langsethiae]GKU20849.1 unnamed protein product [Fusarium langsethiae]